MNKANSLVLRGNIVDIFDRKIYGAAIHIEGKTITAIEPTGREEKGYILPGFIDSHVHIESSMATPNAFAHAAVRHGTLGVVADPHEIANVLGVAGIDYMIDNANGTPFYFYFGAPSCVPASPFETNGGIIDAEETRKLLERDDIHFLGEMMNYPGVLHHDPEVMQKIEAAKAAQKPIDGHFPLNDSEALKAYIAAGIQTDHETENLENAIEKCKLGMFIQIREGSAAKNFEMLHPLLKLYPEMVMFCSDDSHPGWLIEKHIRNLVKRALAYGHDLFDVLRAASYTPALHYNIPLGFLRPGDSADFICVDDLEALNIRQSYFKGELIFDGEKALFPAKKAEIFNQFKAKYITFDQLEIKAKGKQMRVIVCKDGDLVTREAIVPVHSFDGYVEPDVNRDLLKLVVINRYRKTPPAIAFIQGMGLKMGAVAQSIAHDSHNIIAVGATDYELVQAINGVIRDNGGICVAYLDETVSLPLPIAGIMSPLSIDEINAKYHQIEQKIKALRTPLTALQMTLAFMGLTVIPDLKLSDRGLFDSKAFAFTNLFL